MQNRRLGKRGTLTVKDHEIEVIRRFKYIGTVIKMIAKMKRKKSEQGFWQLIKSTFPCKP